MVESGKMMTYAAVAVGAIGVAGLLFWMSKPPRRMRRKLITKFTTLKDSEKCLRS